MMRLFRLATLIVVLSQRHLHGADDERASVRVEVWTSADEILHNARIELIEQGTKVPVNAPFRDSVAYNVPYGQYLLRIGRPAFRRIEQLLKVYQSRVSIRVKLAVATADDAVDPLKIRGVIRAANTADLWVKIVPILDGEPPMDSSVQEDGRFELTGMNSGSYLLILIRGQRVVLMKEVSVPSSQSELSIVVP